MEQSNNNIYFVKDGKKNMNEWDFFNEIGWIDKLKQDSKIIINPTHNFELLKPFRLDLFKEKESNFIEERKINKLNTTDFELNGFYLVWLYNEIKVIDLWLTNKDTNVKRKQLSTSDQIEILKYKEFVLNEIEDMMENPRKVYH